ncbi:glycoside hydrolase [Streptomyces sp. TRM43335]|uniref:Glycoside hydrolase n=1 Tax=Streptomyces taklimakanensis TaxID=2569853 RepID=A0A6G2BE28_9ACTN|nr:C40 family peptidase [Streptomyces taklimakanensis]MTE20464.1 glycoside hydrolase [Streptomyces taklimakanensis]
MSQTAHIPSHRKPRRAGRNPLLRTGVAGGVLSTLAVTAAAAPSSAEERKTAADTVEMPTIVPDLAAGIEQAADASRTIATHYETEAARARAAEKAMAEAAKRAEAEAKAKAEAERRAAAAEAARKERAEREARERASRDAQRTTLTTGTTGTTSTANTTATATAPTGGNAATLVSFLRAQVGKSYVMGATGPSAYDCSGLTQAAFRQIGISLPRTSQSQSTAGTQVSLGNLRPGDILYWGGAGSAYHVAVYIGGGRFVGAQNPSTGVVERDMSHDMPTGAVRVL